MRTRPCRCEAVAWQEQGAGWAAKQAVDARKGRCPYAAAIRCADGLVRAS